MEKIKTMNPTTQSPTNSVHPVRQQRILRLPARWRLVFLSTGEVTLESHLASIGKRVKAGQQVRVIDLSADAGAQMGVFNHSHDMNAADLADHLKQQSRQHYGCLALD
ncbi:hypothetical protein PSECIP111951_00877 [Pseudoalteromonas holothuriae]|uniref:Uncharacterized protein n=1 Tax=Pseudoalteromonas holothuriae TaxID=2963714 RepID=A0ABM9GFW9_9GAMM|nr:hypothetical protein PSECIP111951_00877 [Pseudoalteromonas sp. CIP111951]